MTCPDWVRSGYCVPGRPGSSQYKHTIVATEKREHTIAMCVYKQSYECLYKAEALLKWFLPHNMPAWRGNHIPQPIVTFITFHLQLPPFTGQARPECQSSKNCNIQSRQGNLHNDVFIQGHSQTQSDQVRESEIPSALS